MMLGYIERIVSEKHELDVRLGKLEKALETKRDLFNPTEIELMTNQIEVMKRYSNILKMRMEYAIDKECK